jgi:hypothetical protein
MRASLVVQSASRVAPLRRVVGKQHLACIHTTKSLVPAEDKPPRRTFTSLNQETPYQLCFLRHGQVSLMAASKIRKDLVRHFALANA